MHGVILYNFRQFAIERYGASVWDKVSRAAGLEERVYVPVRMFPDEDLEALVGALEQETGLRRESQLEDFGRWVIPALIKLYRPVIPPHWDAVQFLLHLEERIHQRVIRRHNPTARPPCIEVLELAPRVLEIRYRSHRDLSVLAVGCVHGVADWYGDRAEIMECDRDADGRCRFVVRLKPMGQRNTVRLRAVECNG